MKKDLIITMIVTVLVLIVFSATIYWRSGAFDKIIITKEAPPKSSP